MPRLDPLGAMTCAGRPLRLALDRPDTRLLLEHLLTLGCIHVE